SPSRNAELDEDIQRTPQPSLSQRFTQDIDGRETIDQAHELETRIARQLIEYETDGNRINQLVRVQNPGNPDAPVSKQVSRRGARDPPGPIRQLLLHELRGHRRLAMRG